MCLYVYIYVQFFLQIDDIADDIVVIKVYVEYM